VQLRELARRWRRQVVEAAAGRRIGEVPSPSLRYSTVPLVPAPPTTRSPSPSASTSMNTAAEDPCSASPPTPARSVSSTKLPFPSFRSSRFGRPTRVR
jgi:hypothetical protein